MRYENNAARKRLKIALIIILSLLLISGAVVASVISYKYGYEQGFADNQPITKDGSKTVYITPSGKKYHKNNCHLLNDKIEISEKQAQEKGYVPCKNCKPQTTHKPKLVGSSYAIPLLF